MSDFLAAETIDESPSIRRIATPAPPIPPTDGERLMRFRRHRDQAAFAEVVEAHAAMVWGVCAQILRHRQDVEDAFQATFLILARKGKSIRAADSAAGWLYRVAFRTALLARTRRRRRAELPLVDEPSSMEDQLGEIARNEQCLALLEELHSLPLQYREPLVLCYLEGRTRREAADELGVTPQSVKGRLARGTRMLRSRLVSRGTALSGAMAAVTASVGSAQAGAAPSLLAKTAALAATFGWKLPASTLSGAALKGSAACTLAEKGIIAMTLTAAAKPAIGLISVFCFAGMLTVAAADGPGGKGGASAGPTVLLVADDDTAEDSASDDIDIAISENEEENESLEEEKASAADVDGEKTAAEGEGTPAPAPKRTKRVRAVIAAATAGIPPADAAPAVAAVPAAPATPAPAAAPAPGPVAPQDVLIEVAAGEAPTPVRAPLKAPPQNFRLRVPAPMQGESMLDDLMLARSAASPATLKLEAEYWQLKARGLEKKAEALQLKAQTLEKSGSGSRVEVLEAEAEADLARAEVMQCRMNSQRVEESLKAAEETKSRKKTDVFQHSFNFSPNPMVIQKAAAQAQAAQAGALARKAAAASESLGKKDAALKARRMQKEALQSQAAQLKEQMKALKDMGEALEQQLEGLEQSDGKDRSR